MGVKLVLQLSQVQMPHFQVWCALLLLFYVSITAHQIESPLTVLCRMAHSVSGTCPQMRSLLLVGGVPFLKNNKVCSLMAA